MNNQPIQLHDLKPLQIGKTHNAKEDEKKYYIMLMKTDDTFTVFSTEGLGIVMDCHTKRLLVDVCFTPEGENISLYTYNYPDEFYESWKQKAIDSLKNKKRIYGTQAKWLGFEVSANLNNKEEEGYKTKNETIANTLSNIKKAEEEMIDAILEKRKNLSSKIERGAIARYVKQLTEYKCLICEALGTANYSFLKRNSNERYIETHHIENVSLQKKGSLALHNLITVCPNHHRQFHYGNLELIDQTEELFTFKIDDSIIKVEKLRIQ